MSDRCIPCERAVNWIELDFRDENNQGYQGITVTIEDAAGAIQTLELSSGPNLIHNIANGPVKVTMESEPLILMVEDRAKRNEKEPSAVIDYSKTEKGGPKAEVDKSYLHATLGDFWIAPPEHALPEEHNPAQLGAIHLFHNESYVIEIQDYSKPEIRFGIFFDGTGNNSFNVDIKAQCDNPAFISDELKENCIEIEKISANNRGSYDNSKTNIGRLSESYDARRDNTFSIYMEGVGTKALQEDEVYDMGLGIGDRGVVAISNQAIDKLLAEVINLPYRINNTHIIFDLFGFSRGAATARHFANEIHKKEKGLLFKKLQLNASAKVTINFIGLYDSVAAIGQLRDGYDTKDANNYGVNLYLPKNIANKVLQLTAHDEYRANFALNSIAPEHQEVALLGVHSDIGGGYKDTEDKVMIMRPYIRRYNRGEQRAVDRFYQKANAKINQAKQEFSSYITSSSQFSTNNISHSPSTRDKIRYKATLTMSRTINPDLQLVSYKLMHKIASEYDVPLKADSQPIHGDLGLLYSYYDKHIDGAKGLSIINNIPSNLSSSVLKNYTHCSDHWALSGGLIYAMKPRVNASDVRERKIHPHTKQKGYPF